MITENIEQAVRVLSRSQKVVAELLDTVNVSLQSAIAELSSLKHEAAQPVVEESSDECLHPVETREPQPTMGNLHTFHCRACDEIIVPHIAGKESACVNANI